MSNVVFAAVTFMALASATTPAGAAGDERFTRHLGRDRILVALAPAAADPELAKQRAIFGEMALGARERDLVFVEAVDGTAAGSALRKRFGGSGFRAVLVGKDGGAKLDADHPLGPDVLFPLIDSMPMRQRELRRAP